jgi:hypothetical protein
MNKELKDKLYVGYAVEFMRFHRYEMANGYLLYFFDPSRMNAFPASFFLNIHLNKVHKKFVRHYFIATKVGVPFATFNRACIPLRDRMKKEIMKCFNNTLQA